jgi:hypothetical protein
MMRRPAAVIVLSVALLALGGAAPRAATAQEPTQRTSAPGAVVALRGTPHLWIADDGGVLHWVGDTKALTSRRADWSNRTEVGLDELTALARGTPWLSAGLVKVGDPIYLAKWETGESRPRLLQVQSVADVELFGIDAGNYGALVLDQPAWERKFGIRVPDLERAPLPAAVASATAPNQTADRPIYVGNTLSAGYDMGVATSGGRYDWVTDGGGYIQMRYPAGQDWGAVFITVGKPAPAGQRLARDFSGYRTLAVDLKGEQGGETVQVGLKDATDPDDGRESKVTVRLTAEWRTCRFPLQSFATADLTRLYIPVEFVFAPRTAETVSFRNVRFLGEPSNAVSCS